MQQTEKCLRNGVYWYFEVPTDCLSEVNATIGADWWSDSFVAGSLYLHLDWCLNALNHFYQTYCHDFYFCKRRKKIHVEKPFKFTFGFTPARTSNNFVLQNSTHFFFPPDLLNFILANPTPPPPFVQPAART